MAKNYNQDTQFNGSADLSLSLPILSMYKVDNKSYNR